jgi:RNA polymerase sigma factor (sigma-70 family)
MSDTTDLVHDAIVRTLGRGGAFEPRSERALAGYLREAVRNRIRDEHRRVARRGIPDTPGEAIVDPGPSPFEQAAASEAEAKYRGALARLGEKDRELIVAHVELDYSHEQLGCMTRRSPNAARMALQRALGRLAAQMAAR